MRSLSFIMLLSCGTFMHAQNTNPSAPPSKPPAADSASKPAPPRTTSLAPPRSDSVNVNSIPAEPGVSSSKDTQIDLSPPSDDAKAHPQSSEVLMDMEGASPSGDLNEFHPWDPHKAAKSVEVGDFYFKRKNYRAAEDRYREALLYKDNDAVATYRLGVCLEKMYRPNEARTQYENYLKILPHGPEAEEAKKAIERLQAGLASKAAPKP